MSSFTWSPVSSGSGGGGSGANTTLSNLTAPTAINQDLIFVTGTAVNIKTVDKMLGSGVAGDALTIATGAGAPGTVFSHPSGSGGMLTIAAGAGGRGSALDAKAANGGSILISPGNGGDMFFAPSAGDGGNLTLTPGLAGSGGGGVNGTIRFQNSDEGTVGHVWTSTDSSGSGHWAAAGGGGANTTLSNLTDTVAINKDLIFDRGTVSALKTKDATGTYSEKLLIKTGDVDNGYITGELELVTGGVYEYNSGNTRIATGGIYSTSGYSSGNLSLLTGDVTGTNGGTGYVSIKSGMIADLSNTVGSGLVMVGSGSATLGTSGALYLYSGDSGAGSSGAIFLTSGTGGSGSSGVIQVTTGNSAGAASGEISLTTGSTFAGEDTGHITLLTGTTSGTAGKIRFQNSNEGTVGHVWTSTDAVGSGRWTNPSISLARIVTGNDSLSATTDRTIVLNGGGAGPYTLSLPAGIQGLKYSFGVSAANVDTWTLVPYGLDTVDIASVNSNIALVYIGGTWYQCV